ncbi:MAG: hypothetical protein U9N76_02285, partial [Candidatus Marinimicrobia bacterium]|nr:hypothetical protein [Candidatus Neomarinimicrobiota bacterium]
MEKINKINTYFFKILINYRKQKAKYFLTKKLLSVFYYNFIYLFILIISESIWYFGSTIKTIFMIPFLINFSIFYFIIQFVKIRNVNSNICNNESILRKIGNKFPNIKDKLVNIYQLSKNNDELSLYAIEKFENKYPSNNFL